MAFSENLKSFRNRVGMTQAELAEAVGVAQSTIAQYEIGLKIPTIIIGVRLADVLHTDCHRLVEESKKGATP